MYKTMHMDVETRSDLDLRKVGLHRYADLNHTTVLCMAYAFDDGPVQTWRMGNYFPREVLEHIKSGGEVSSHNAVFEREIFNNTLAPLTDQKVQISLEQCDCTMARAFAMALPGSLEGCAAALGVDQRKDLEGSRLMMQMCKPKEILPDGKIIWWDDQERMDRLVKYCVQDVIVEREIGKRMFKLSPYEKKVWILDQQINSRGIVVDRKAVEKAVDLVEKEKDRLNEDMRTLTKNQVATCTAVQQIKDYLEFYGVSEDALAKSDVTGLLERTDLHPHARKVLELRSQGGKAATAKLEPMLNGIGDDNRLRGMFQYSGANTRRWAGRRVQLQNLKSPALKHDIIDEIVNNISQGMSAEVIDLVYGPPLSILADCTRAFLTAAPNHELVTCDFSAIEARVLAWLAGQDNVLDVFRSGADIYKHAATGIFRVKYENVNPKQRTVAKVATLALGYAGGAGAFQQMAKGYNVKMAPAFNELWNSVDDNTRAFAEERFKQAGGQYEIEREEFLASEITKIMWRNANPRIVDYWAQAEKAFIDAVLNPGDTFRIGRDHRSVKFKKSGSFMFAQLPSGGVISYPYPTLQDTKTPWGAMKMLPSYMSEDGQSKKWQRFSTYSGSLVENICQATARDLLADALLRLDDAGFKTVAHVHDECVCEVPSGKNYLPEMEKIMTHNPKWAFDLPMAASGWQGFRYRKG